MDDAALVRGHRFDGDLAAEAHSLFREFVGEAAQRLLALVAITLAVDDDALVFLPADVGDRPREDLEGIQHFAAVADQRIGVGGDHVDAGVLGVFIQFGGRRDVQDIEHAFQKGDGALAVRLFAGNAHARLDPLGKQASLFALFQHDDVRFLTLEAHRLQAGRDRLVDRLAGEFHLCHFVFPPFRTSFALRAACGIL